MLCCACNALSQMQGSSGEPGGGRPRPAAGALAAAESAAAMPPPQGRQWTEATRDRLDAERQARPAGVAPAGRRRGAEVPAPKRGAAPPMLNVTPGVDALYQYRLGEVAGLET